MHKKTMLHYKHKNFTYFASGLLAVVAIIIIFSTQLPIAAKKAFSSGNQGADALASLANGLVLHYTFDNADMTNGVGDSSGNGYNGVLQGDQGSLVLEQGQLGQAIHLTKAHSEYILLPGNAPTVTDFSVAVWIKTGDYNSLGNQTIWNVPPFANTDLQIAHDGNLNANINNANQASPTLSAGGDWMHIVETRSGSTLTIYVNGVQVASNTGADTSSINFANGFVGSTGTSDPYNFDGLMDDFRLYNRVLTSDEVTSLYNDTDSQQTQQTNQAPSVYAGADTTATVGTPISLTGTVLDDGLPTPASLTQTWSKVSGPGTITFSAANSLTTNATFSTAGTYVIQLDGYDSALHGDDTVSVVVAADSVPPVISGAGPSGLLASGTTNATLTATTNEPATCKYSSTDQAYSSMGSTFSSDGSLQTTHTSSVSGLSDGVLSIFYIRCQDSSSNADATSSPVFIEPILPTSGPLPADRSIDWSTAGISGGIPDYTSECANVKTDFGAKGDGTTNDTSAFQNAINSCSNSQYLYIPAGNYILSGTLVVSKSISLRGAGPRITTLTPSNTIEFSPPGTGGGYENQTFAIDWLAGYAKGTTQITLANTSNLHVGQEIVLDEPNDPSMVNPTGDEGSTCGSSNNAGGCGREGLNFEVSSTPGPRTLQQIAKVVSISGNNIVIDTPLYVNYVAPSGGDCTNSPTDNCPQIFFWAENGIPGNLQKAGIEDLSINAANVYDALGFSFCTDCWVQKIEGYNIQRIITSFLYSYEPVVRDSYFHDQTGSDAYTTQLLDVSKGLIENNIYTDAGNAIINNGPMSGNVIAYNYISTPRNPGNNVLPSIDTHIVHHDFNLFEGNVVNQINLDDIWGSGSYETLYRNRIFGEEVDIPGYSENYEFPIVIEAWNRFENVIGNVLGVSGLQQHYEYSHVNIPASSAGGNAIYSIGFWNKYSDIYDNGSTPDFSKYDDVTYATLLRHGNFDFVTDQTQWNSAIGNHNLPASLYLSSQPAWWGSSAWPAIGPDVDTSTGHDLLAKIPAQNCYLTQSLQTGGAFDPDSCYYNISPPQASTTISLIASVPSANGAVITWTTSAVANSMVGYGLTNAYGNSSSLDASMLTSHTIALSGLNPNTVYHYKVVSVDGNGYTIQSSDNTFTTSVLVINNPPPDNSQQSSGGASVSQSSSGGGGSVSVPVTQTAVTAPIASPVATMVGSTITKDLALGSKDPQVTVLQDFLIDHNLMASNVIKGYYGPITVNAIKVYQKENNLPQAGSVGPLTRTAINNTILAIKTPVTTSIKVATVPAKTTAPVVAKATKPAAAPAPAVTAAVFKRTLAVGSTGDDVKALQEFLNDHGFLIALSGSGSKGNESTYYGPTTAAAVSRFQTFYSAQVLQPYGLAQATGSVGPATIKQLQALIGENS